MIGVLGGSVYIQDNQIKQRSHLDQSATGECCVLHNQGLVSCNIIVQYYKNIILVCSISEQ